MIILAKKQNMTTNNQAFVAAALWAAFTGLAVWQVMISPHMQLGLGWCTSGFNGSALHDGGRIIGLLVFTGHCPWCPTALMGALMTAFQLGRGLIGVKFGASAETASLASA